MSDPAKESSKLIIYLRELQEEHPDFPHDQEISVKFTNLLGETPLHVASWRGDEEIACEMVMAGADVNAVGEGGEPPLHYAIERGLFALVALLLRNGANIFTANFIGDSPLSLAEESGNAALIEIVEGARVDKGTDS